MLFLYFLRIPTNKIARGVFWTMTERSTKLWYITHR